MSDADQRMPDQRMTVRRMRFPYPANLKAWWNPARPEFSQVVNAGSLAMPYLEPYLIETMRKAREKLTDAQLIAEVDLYIAQEATHYRQHRQFNKRLADLGYESVPRREAILKDDYDAFARARSFTFNIAYAEGFESMGLAVGNMLIEDRDYLFRDGDTAVASLVLWHFVEEIEHKCVTFDVFKALDGRYWWRIYGVLYATIHIFGRSRQAYRELLIEDGIWFTLRSRLALYGLLGRIFLRLTPRLLRIFKPSYDPRQVEDPSWVKEWWRLHREGREGLGELDMSQLTASVPVARAA